MELRGNFLLRLTILVILFQSWSRVGSSRSTTTSWWWWWHVWVVGIWAAQACVCLSRQTKMRETVAMFAIIAHQHVLVENLFLQCASVFQLKSRGGGLYYDEIQCPASSFRYLESCFSFHACWMSGRRCTVLLAPLVLKLERSFLTFPFFFFWLIF